MVKILKKPRVIIAMDKMIFKIFSLIMAIRLTDTGMDNKATVRRAKAKG